MINQEDLKPGVFVWWSADRYIHEFSCPCVVTVVNENTFSVRSLDDFRTHHSLRMHDESNDKPSNRGEMSLTTAAEVRRYVQDRLATLQERARKATEELDGYQDRAGMFLARLP